MNEDSNYLKKELYELIKTDDSVFEFLQSGSLDGLWYWDIENPENEWMNSRFWITLGYDPTKRKHLASEWQDIIHHKDLQVALDNFSKHCLDPNHLYDQIVQYTHKNGSTVWIRCRGIAIRDNNGKPIRMLGAHSDITPLKRAEKALSEKEIKYRTLFESSLDSFFILNLDNNYQFVECNQAAVDLFKFDGKSDIIGTTLANLSPEFQLNGKLSSKLSIELINKAFSDRSHEFEWMHLKANGTPFPVLVTMSVLNIGSNRLLLVVIRDLTEIKNAESKKNALIKELQVALDEIKQLQGFLPICSFCKKIRNDKGYWEQIEEYISKHTDAKFSHGLCPECLQENYPDATK